MYACTCGTPMSLMMHEYKRQLETFEKRISLWLNNAREMTKIGSRNNGFKIMLGSTLQKGFLCANSQVHYQVN